jgi:hypothetical protein
MEYPKINSLWKRQGWYFDAKDRKDLSLQAGRQSFIVGDYACPEFAAINRWMIDEKVDGTNVRIFWDPNDPVSPTFGGRTENSQLPTTLLQHLLHTFTRDKMARQFPSASKVVLFGEGYGPKIQAVGARYRSDVSFILFDAWIDGWWLEKNRVLEVAAALDIEHTIRQEILSTDEVVQFVKSRPKSYIAEDSSLVMEGVIARSYPLMLFRNNHTPIMFKLKVKEFASEEGA